MIPHVLREQKSTFLRAGRTEIRLLAGERPEGLILAVRISGNLSGIFYSCYTSTRIKLGGDGCRLVVRNGYMEETKLTTGMGVLWRSGSLEATIGILPSLGRSDSAARFSPGDFDPAELN